MRISRVVFGVYLLVFVSAELNLIFLRELQSYQLLQPVAFNVIVCPGSGQEIELIKELSRSSLRFVAVHEADKAFGPFSEEPQAFVLDLQCPLSNTILQQAEILGLFKKPFKWFLLASGENLQAGNQSESEINWPWPFLEPLSFLADSDVKLVEQISSEKQTITGVYKLQTTLLKEPLAEWTPQNGLTVLNSKSLSIRRWNLQKVVIPSSMIVLYPDSVNHFDDFVDPHLDRTTKINYNHIKLLEDLFNASVKIKIIKDWGTLVNGSWTGMVGDFERKEIEIGGSPLFFQKQRTHFIEYYDIITPNGISFIFLSPPLSSSRNIFAMPFDEIVWYCCLAMVSTSCVFMFFAINYERAQTRVTEKGKGQQESKVSFIDIIIVNIGAVCQQGTVTQTKNPPGRIITLFLYLSYMFLYISYSGAIVAILQSSDTSIRTLQDFLNSPLKAGVEDVVYNRFYFTTAEDTVRKSIYEKKVAPKGQKPHFLPLEEGIGEVRKGFYGFHVELSVGYQVIQQTFTEEEKCALQVLKETFLLYIEPWFVMKKKSPYSEIVKIGAKKLKENGISHRFTSRFFTKKPICTSKSSRFVSVGLIDCFYAFVLLVYGYLLAFIILVVELCYDKYSKKLKKRRRTMESHQAMFLN